MARCPWTERSGVIEPAFLGTAHFFVGCVAVIAGFAAFAARKGSFIHRSAGMVFLVAMTLLALSGLWLSIARNILFTVFLSLIALHSFASGWAAAGKMNPFGRLVTKISPLASAGIMVGAVIGGVIAAAAPGGMLNDLPPSAFYILASVAGLLFVFDFTYTKSSAPSEQRRLTRHGWRMGFSFFLATGIFFLGNNHVLPEILRVTAILVTPILAVVIWTLYYAVKTRFSTLGPKRH